MNQIETVARADLIDELALAIDQFLSHRIERDTLACDLTQDELTELATGLAAIAAMPVQAEPVAFQQEVDRWMDACFGQTIKADKLERCDRFLEEALEFVQAVGYSADRAHALVDYVFGRDVGEVKQEVGGVMVTLAAACNTVGVDIQGAAQTELARVWTKVEAIRAKQAAKPTGSALPIPTPPAGGSDAE